MTISHLSYLNAFFIVDTPNHLVAYVVDLREVRLSHADVLQYFDYSLTNTNTSILHTVSLAHYNNGVQSHDIPEFAPATFHNTVLSDLAAVTQTDQSDQQLPPSLKWTGPGNDSELLAVAQTAGNTISQSSMRLRPL